MSESLVLVIIGCVWLAVGLALSVVMGRRGHNGFGWLVLGTVLGPLGVVLALDAGRHEEHLAPVVIQPEGRARGGAGPVDVLVGYDGSPESAAALDAVRALLGRRLGRLTVATVAPYGDVRELERQHEEMLRALAHDVPGRHFQLEVLHGQPAAALRERAATGSYELIAVGTRGRGITKAILGSAASELASHSGVPVLLVGGTRRATGTNREASEHTRSAV